MAPIKMHNIAMGGILCDVENMKISCNLMLAGRHLWECDIILDFFSLSYSGCDLTLIFKEPHIKLLFVFTKVLIKNKNLDKLVVDNCGSSIYY